MLQFFLEALRRPRVSAAVVVAIAALSSPARAAEALNPAEQTARAKAIAVVDVKLSTGKEKTAVTVLRMLRGEDLEVRPGGTWLSGCLPDRKDFQQWLRRHPRSSERKLWKDALNKPGYQAVVFLVDPASGRPGGLIPICGSEAMDLLHTDLHPEYPSYLKRIEALIKAAPTPAL